MLGIRFTKYTPGQIGRNQSFENLLKIFLQLLTISSGDVSEALNWLNQLDQKYGLTNDQYGVGNFIDDLKDKGYLEENENNQTFNITSKTEQSISKQSLGRNFWKIKKIIPRKSSYSFFRAR